MASVGAQTAYATDIFAVQRVYYHQYWSFGYQWMMVMSTQLIGFSIGGVARRFLVAPPSMSQCFHLTSIGKAHHKISLAKHPGLMCPLQHPSFSELCRYWTTRWYITREIFYLCLISGGSLVYVPALPQHLFFFLTGRFSDIVPGYFFEALRWVPWSFMGCFLLGSSSFC